jgi:hypothetical protein
MSNDTEPTITLTNTTLFIIAYTLYNIDCITKQQDILEWEQLTQEQRNYWCTLVVGVIQVISNPSKPMIKAALKEMRKPVAADKKTWEEHQTDSFIRYHKAALGSLMK